MITFIKWDAYKKFFLCQDEWNFQNNIQLQKQFKKINFTQQKNITLDGGAITKMDSSGASFLTKWITEKKRTGYGIQLQNFHEKHLKLMRLVEEHSGSASDLPKLKTMNSLARLGKLSILQFKEVRDFLTFVGYLTHEAIRVIRHPSHIRFPAFVKIIEKSGWQALPIIALLSFMIGVVIAYQTGLKLQEYGANIFIVDLVGFAVLREFAPLITSIIVAGRTGSAFTAQLGIMKINQEIDALNTMGVTPAELLILPRMAGLLITLPLLTMWADIFGVLGGLIMSHNMLHITWYEFINRFQREVHLRALLIGLGKAPIFALIIGGISCFEGVQVQRNANSVGERTTKSVVWSIFFIIVTDALLSILFSKLKL